MVDSEGGGGVQSVGRVVTVREGVGAGAKKGGEYRHHPDAGFALTKRAIAAARGIHVAEYLTELPPREVLEDRLHRAIEAARNRLVLGVDVDVASLAPTSSTADSKPKGRGRRK